MPLPAIIIAAGLVIGQASGIVTTAANAVIAVDKTVTAITDLHKYGPQVETLLRPTEPPAVKVKKIARKKP